MDVGCSQPWPGAHPVAAPHSTGSWAIFRIVEKSGWWHRGSRAYDQESSVENRAWRKSVYFEIVTKSERLETRDLCCGDRPEGRPSELRGETLSCEDRPRFKFPLGLQHTLESVVKSLRVLESVELSKLQIALETYRSYSRREGDAQALAWRSLQSTPRPTRLHFVHVRCAPAPRLAEKVALQCPEVRGSK